MTSIFKDWEHERISEVLECRCGDYRCTGKYIQVYEKQRSCYWSFMRYVDKSGEELDEICYNQFIISNNQKMDYTPEEKKDIGERTAKAAALLKELNLEPRAQVTSGNAGDDVFGLKVIVYLQDLKYKK